MSALVVQLLVVRLDADIGCRVRLYSVSLLAAGRRALDLVRFGIAPNPGGPWPWRHTPTPTVACCLALTGPMAWADTISLSLFGAAQMISLQGKTNFFEKKVTDYQKAGVMSSNQGSDNSINFDEEF